VGFVRDIEKLIRLSIPVSDKRAQPRHSEPPVATRGPARSANGAPAKQRQRQGRRGEDARQHRHNGQPKETADGIASVAFLHRPAPAGRDVAARAPRWTGHSRGS